MVLNGFGRSDNCQACLDAGYSCADCKATRVCGTRDCYRTGRRYMKGLSGFTDSIADAAKSVAGCPIPFLIGIGVGYLIKKSGMLKKVTL